MELYEKLAQIKSALPDLQQYCLNLFDNYKYVIDSASSYAEKRREIHIRRFVRTRDNHVRILRDVEKEGLERLEELGDRLFKKIGYDCFDHALLLEYSQGGKIDLHGDSAAYFGDKDNIGQAISVEVLGSADFIIAEWKDKPKGYSKDWKNWDKEAIHQIRLDPGSVLAFQNKQPHGVKPVLERRIVICYFKLKPEYLVKKEPAAAPTVAESLPLFNLQLTQPSKPTVGVAHYSTPGTLYVGRGMEKLKLSHSEFHNPFKVSDYGREECLRRFKDYLFSRPELLRKLPTLKGKLLGCHKDCCQGKILPIPETYEQARCHGQILLLAAEELAEGKLVIERTRPKPTSESPIIGASQLTLLSKKVEAFSETQVVEDLTGKEVEVLEGRYLEPGRGIVVVDRKDCLSHTVEVKMIELQGTNESTALVQVVPKSHYRVVKSTKLIETQEEDKRVAVLAN